MQERDKLQQLDGRSTKNPSIILMPARTNLVGRGHER